VYCIVIVLIDHTHCQVAFPPSHLSSKLADKLALKVASQTNVTHLCLVCQSEVGANQIGLIQTHPDNFESKFVSKFVAEM
jgi:hypothetical protein